MEGICDVANFQRKENIYYLDCTECHTRSVVYREKLFGFAKWRVIFKNPTDEKVLISVLMNKRAAFQHARQLHTAWRRGVRNAAVSG